MGMPLRPLITLLPLLVLACEYRTDQPSEVARQTVSEVSTHYADPSEHQAFKAALAASGVPFRVVVRDSKEHVAWPTEQEAKVAAIEAKLFGPPLPSGRNVSLDPSNQAAFKAWLNANSIAYTTQVSRGRELIVWSEADSERVRQSRYAPKQGGLTGRSRATPTGIALGPRYRRLLSSVSRPKRYAGSRALAPTLGRTKHATSSACPRRVLLP